MTSSTAVGVLAIAAPAAVALFFIFDEATRDAGQRQSVSRVAFEEPNSDQLKVPALVGSSAVANADGLIVGRVQVVDGDTIDVGGARIRLHGIDAPEKGQNCRKNGQLYSCGQKAASFLRQQTANFEVVCYPLKLDRYGRIVARCAIGEADVGATMVANGWALAYRKYDLAYVPLEDQAKQARRGIWAGQFVRPHDWRAGERL
ncbi:thermonuclease family protein [Ruegeria arenilitoris]|uniref:thermonuclease family protein n=1 Tax=Ruegeria arenilitoris TaxID=1173585 RepID=UPI00147C832F|nr:thermonuclease family protein [Ruegeria arenilitoris]